MSVMYVIGKVGYEFNDEVYHLPHSGSSTAEPVLVYRTRARAEDECRKLNMLEIAKMDPEPGEKSRYHDSLENYGYGPNEIFKDVDVIEDLLRKYSLLEKDDRHPEPEQYYKLVPKLLKRNGITDLEISLALNAIKVKFYEVYEVEIGDE